MLADLVFSKRPKIELFGLSTLVLAVILVAAFLSAVLHGTTGMAGGIVLTAVLAYLVGIKAAIPVMTCALIFSHSSRAVLFIRHIEWATVKIVLLFAMPTIGFGALVFTHLSPTVIASVMALFLALSFPLKAAFKRREMITSNSVLATASAAWGLLAGNVIGPGFVLAPFLLGRGLDRQQFVGSLAFIVLAMNGLKLVVFTSTTMIDMSGIWLGVLVGIVTIPGNWVGKALNARMSNEKHQLAIDVMTILLIINYAFIALTQ